MNCESCGMPMENAEMHGAGDEGCKYCKFCAPDGNLKPREEVREGWIGFAMATDKINREEAEKKIDAEMAKMPAWK